ncbi:MAG: glucose-6-phosphate dehydrogenase assembly protein OpcA [Candidatus Methylomirabilales bacterium]
MGLKNDSQSSSGVNVQAIERDLRNLWEQMAEATQVEGREPVMRACVLNLIVYAPGERTAGEVNQIMAEVTTQHPSRVFVMLPKYEAAEPALSAWVTAQCHLSAGGHKQVCCEQIMITAEDGAIYRLPSLVRPLLVPDLPVVLWWRDSLSFASRLFDELLETADRVIIDTAALPDPLEGLARLAALIRQQARWTAFSDLSWARLTPWRGLVAGFFDVPDYRPYLMRLNRVEIKCGKDREDHDLIPVQALQVIGWLASRLRWQPRSRLQWTDTQACQLELTVDNQPILIQIKTSPSTDDTPAGLHVIRLSTERKPSARFVVSRSGDGLHLQSSVELAGMKLIGKVARLNGHSEAQLISKELEILSHDTVYGQALEFVSGLKIKD